MWEKIKSLCSIKATLTELAQIGKDVVRVVFSNKLKIFSTIALFGVLDAIVKYMVFNGEVGSGILVGGLTIVGMLFIPVMFYLILTKKSFKLISDFDDNVGFLRRVANKYSFFRMCSRFHKTLIIILGAGILGMTGNSLLPAFVPSLYGLDKIDNLNVWNMLIIAPFVLFFVYVLFVGGLIAAIKSLSDNLSLKQIVIFSIKKSLSSFLTVVILLGLFVGVMLLVSYTIGGLYYLMSFVDYILLAVFALTVYALTLDRTQLSL